MALFLFLLVILTGKMFLVRLQPPFLPLGIDRQVPHQLDFMICLPSVRKFTGFCSGAQVLLRKALAKEMWPLRHDLELVSALIKTMHVESCHVMLSEKPSSFLNRAEKEFLSSFWYFELLKKIYCVWLHHSVMCILQDFTCVDKNTNLNLLGL